MEVRTAPKNPLLSGTQTNGETTECAVANTTKGKIPGKAKGTICWYPYGGMENTTKDFKYISSPLPLKHQKNDPNDQKVPDGALVTGNQTDGAGELCSAIANSQYGRIPGKAKGNTCWYPYGGIEHSTQDFDFIVYDTSYGGKDDSVTTAKQTNGDTVYCAVANTEHGMIPCKASNNEYWYPYGGKEHGGFPIDNKVVYLTSDRRLKRVKNTGHGPPAGAFASGYQTDGAGTLYSAIATVAEGQIPGKAKENKCWYPYGGKEEETTNFEWIVKC